MPPPLRYVFEPLGSPAVIAHLVDLGVTSVELLPVQAFVDERMLVEKRLRNFWGYNSIGFFAPDPRYFAAHPDEFKSMVKNLHAAGLEVILDVVYNHTAEGNHLGPTLSFRGIDNASYYRLEPDKRYYEDATGCGNTLDLRHPRVLQLVTDSLRYWVQEMHVDGFRFDLASALAREDEGYTRRAAFFKAIAQDPVLAGQAGRRAVGCRDGRLQVGPFRPAGRNGTGYRDTVRRFWRGSTGVLPDLASRIAGSSDIYAHGGRRPRASVNFVTVHDGFTLNDLVSYNEKHNEANGEGNRDGTDDNASWNGGAEGPTDDPEVNAVRERQKRNLFATLFLSLGVPLMLAGDEFGRTQRGNNNAYCQDNEISWIDWNGRTPEDFALTEFVKVVLRMRREHPAFRRDAFFSGAQLPESARRDIAWLTPAGTEMTEADWHSGGHAIGVFFGVRPMFAMLLNAGEIEVTFTLPDSDRITWGLALDTVTRRNGDEANGTYIIAPIARRVQRPLA